MSETDAAMEDHHAPGHYEIRIKGLLDNRWAEWFEGLTIMGSSHQMQSHESS